MTNKQHNAAAQVAALLAEAGSAPPPADLRQRLLATAGSIPSVADRLVASTPAEVYETQAMALLDLCQTLTPAQWQLTAAPYEWKVHELVAHVFVGEVYTAQVLGLPTQYDQMDGSNHLETGADVIAQQNAVPTRTTLQLCGERIQATVKRLPELTVDGDNTFVEYHGWPMPIDPLLIVRSFEFWTHADDIRRAIGAPTEDPSPSDLRAMSFTSVQNLDLIIAVAFPGAPTGRTRIVLTGPGGGTFDIGSGEERVTTAVIDVVDYCRMAARRLPPPDMPADIEGNLDVAGALWEAARALAM
jgi:uncharacterized protein (TIGR03083 family)